MNRVDHAVGGNVIRPACWRPKRVIVADALAYALERLDAELARETEDQIRRRARRARWQPEVLRPRVERWADLVLLHVCAVGLGLAAGHLARIAVDVLRAGGPG